MNTEKYINSLGITLTGDNTMYFYRGTYKT